MKAAGGMLTIGLAVAILFGSVAGESAALVESLPPLPSWSPTDSDKLEKGEIIPGTDFFGRSAAEPLDLPPPITEESLPDLEAEEPVPEEFPTEIGEEYLDRYFGAAPLDAEGQAAFLIDPQELLAQQDRRDRESFLHYHAGESDIDMFVYLFDARQELPGEFTIESIYEKHFRNRGACALIFYHVGMPDRSELLLSDDVRAVVSADEQKRALRAGVAEAFEKSDPAYQLDNFLVELSIRLYWIEREMSGMKPVPSQAAAAGVGTGLASVGAHQRDQTWSLISRMLILGALLVVLTLLVWLARCVADRRIRYQFPEVETGPLLGAPHAAGVGAVLSFASAHLPPSQQRDPVPDYLQRM